MENTFLQAFFAGICVYVILHFILVKHGDDHTSIKSVIEEK